MFNSFCNPMDHGPRPASLLCSWDFKSKNSEMVCHFLLQGIFSVHRLNLGPLQVSCTDRHVLYHWATREAPVPCILSNYFILYLSNSQISPDPYPNYLLNISICDALQRNQVLLFKVKISCSFNMFPTHLMMLWLFVFP